MKRFIKKLSALMIAAMLVIMSVSVPVQAKTITQPNRIITLHSGNARTYTRSKRPVKLVYYEGFETKEEAMRREYAIKQLTRKQKLDLMEF